jgi:hemerythrin
LKYLEKQLDNYRIIENNETMDEHEKRIAKEVVLKLVQQMNKFVTMAANKKEVDSMHTIFAQYFIEYARFLDEESWMNKIDYWMTSLSLKRNEEVAKELYEYFGIEKLEPYFNNKLRRL